MVLMLMYYPNTYYTSMYYPNTYYTSMYYPKQSKIFILIWKAD
jgi:hypothetical protein